ncbi:MAG: prohibitin family protein [Saprospiraceae bacterium]
MTNFNPKNPIPINQGKILRYVTFAILGIMLFSLLTSTTFITIDPGYKGVKFKRFQGGIDKDKIYGQGFHVVMPWNDMIVYDVRIQEANEAMDVLSKNGLSINIDLSYRYKTQPDKIGDLHDEIGKDYADRIIKPEIRSATRQVIGEYLPEELYSTKREAIQDEIFEQSKNACSPKFIDIDAILIRSVQLPDKLKEAIEMKLETEQQSLQYKYRLEKERKEAERKIIEAQAKADANRILNASLTDKILRDKGIEATLDLAKSPNSKIVIIGSGDEGLPLILGNN